MLLIEDVYAGYGRFLVLQGVSARIPAGDCHAIIGANGAGKTTLLRTIFGLIKPTQGRVTFEGADVAGVVPETLIRRGLAYVPQQASIFPRLSVRDNLEMGLYSDRKVDPSIIETALERFDVLRRRANSEAGALSGGERRLLEITRALMRRPKVLMLDEPSLGLSPVMMNRVLEELAVINAAGVTVLLVEQRVKAALVIAKNVSVMRLGRIAQQGSAADARQPQWLEDAIYGARQSAGGTIEAVIQ
jgi:ABC-type branched-subunit amino acid transport system ATPase component